MNELARNFVVMVPMTLFIPFKQAADSVATSALLQNLNPNLVQGFSVTVLPNARLNWTNKIAIFRTDGSIKPFIRQTEQEIELKAKAEGSEFEFDNDAWQFGIDAWRGAGYGYWQYACLVTMA